MPIDPHARSAIWHVSDQQKYEPRTTEITKRIEELEKELPSLNSNFVGDSESEEL